MKIAVVGTRGIPNIMGGVETHCEELFPRIAKNGPEVFVMRRTSYVQDACSVWNGVRLIDIKTPRKKAFEAIIHTFRAINRAKRLNVDIVHIHAIGPALLVPYARLLGMKVIFTHHGPDYERAKWGVAAKTMLKLGERMGCRFAHEVIVISDIIKTLIKEKYGRTEHVHMIHNGVSKPETCNAPEYFAELGITEGNYLLGMCRFVPEKNLHHLIEAYADIKSELPSDMKLVLAGDADFDDDYSRNLKELAKRHGVVLTGFIKGLKLHALLTHCRCFCLPSSHEGLPIALLEAMSYGTPVLVSNIPANLEVGLPDEAYFPCGNVAALSDKLLSMARSPFQHKTYEMGKYDWDRIAEQVMAVYVAAMKTK